MASCRAQGFRVADGNTWWYLIASSPWSNVYYVSADAFYNNGATSGSLVGTPFYDPSVPVCVNNQEAPLYFTSVASGSATAHSPTCTYGHYPVNCASGDFWHTFTDISIPGRGPGLKLTRTYNSLSATSNGIFGYGWTSSLDQHLVFNSGGRSDGSIVVILDDGSQIIATPNGSGGYNTPPATESAFRSNSDGTYTLTLRHLTLETFSSAGQLVALADLNGNTTRLAYNSTGQLSSVTDAAGRQVTVTIGANGLVSAVVDPLGHTVSYAYDGNGNLTSVTDALSRVWRYSYDTNHRMLTMTDPRGGVVSNTYDATTGQITKQIDPAGLATTFAYTGDNFGSVGGTTTITDPHGNVRLEQYANGYLMQVTYARGTTAQSTSAYAYDPSTFARTSATDPNGHITTSSYDATGHLLSETDPLGNRTTYTYNSLGEVLTTTSPLGEVTTKTYDAAGNLLTVKDPLNNVTSNAHADPNHPGDVTSVTDPAGHVTQMTYDSFGDIASKTVSPTTGVNDTTTYLYDADGEPLCEAPAKATSAGTTCTVNGAWIVGTTTTSYDAGGQATATTDPNGHSTSSSYDGDGNKTQNTDASGNVTTTSYDADNRVTGVTAGANAPGSSTTTTGYDLAPGVSTCPTGPGASYCTTNTDPNGNITTHVFDSGDREIETIRPGSGHISSFSYDLAGNKTAQTAATGVTTAYGYDADNRLTSVHYSDATPNVSYAYDADGHRTSMVDGTGTSSYIYDAAGRLITLTNGAGANTSYTYDGNGDILSLMYPNGHTVNRTYNSAGWLATVSDWLGNTTTFSFDPDGDLATTTYPNGDVVSAGYDAGDNLASTNVKSSSTSLATISYQRTANNLISQETDTGAISASVSNTYNAQDQLTVSGASTNSYDLAGNITNVGGAAQTFDSAGELTSAKNTQGSVAISYDANGNRTAAQPSDWGRTAHYSYDAENRLVSATLPVVTPAVTGISPNSGSQAGGTSVTITGQGFSETTSVQFGSTPAANVKVVTDAKLVVTAPAHVPGTVDVTVTDSNGTSSTNSADTFTYTQAPGVTSLNAGAGQPAGGNAIQLGGAGFTGATSVKFGTVAATFTVVSDMQINATVPAGSGTVNITVTTPNGTSKAATINSYSYISGVGVTGIGPANGPTTGTTVVTVQGTGFTGATAVSFGTAAAVSFQVTSDNTLTATAPAGTGAVDIKVTGPSGTSAAVSADVFNYQVAPVITSVTPRLGAASGGNMVTVRGSGFTADSLVRLGTITAITRYISSSAVLAIAPAGTGTGDITVSTAGGTSATNASDTYAYSADITGYHYNGDGLRTSIDTTSGTTHFAWDITPKNPLLLDDSTYSYVYGPGDTPIEQIDTAGTPSYYFHDAIGSTRALLNTAGQVAAIFKYSQYGTLTARTGTAFTPILFAGAYLDATTGWYYLIHRYYEATTAQFTTIDPLVSMTHSPYAYASNNPANSKDPNGQIALSLCDVRCIGWDGHSIGVGYGTLGVTAGPVSLGKPGVGASIMIYADGEVQAQVIFPISWFNVGGVLTYTPGHGLSFSPCVGVWAVSVCLPAGGPTQPYPGYNKPVLQELENAKNGIPFPGSLIGSGGTQGSPSHGNSGGTNSHSSGC